MRTIAAFVTLFAAVAARAATIVALPEPELSRKSDAIVFGTILAKRTALGPDGDVYTRAELQVARSVRGPAAGEVITVQVPGGKLPNGLVAHAAGAPELEVGQLVFGFLERWPDGYRPLGLSYGLLKVRKAADGTYRAWRDTSGLAMLAPEGGEQAPGIVQLRDVPLDDLMARVRGHLGPLAPAPDGGFRGPGSEVRR